MLPRDRVYAALRFDRPDSPPVEYHSSPAGMYEHGAALRDLMCRCGQDFGDPATFALVSPDPAAVDADGRYCLRQRDPWGALWECRIFGVAGHPIQRPLDDWADWADFHAPPDPVASSPVPCRSGDGRAHRAAISSRLGGSASSRSCTPYAASRTC